MGGRSAGVIESQVYRRASPLRRTLAFALDLTLFFLLVAVGWILLTWLLASRGQTPGKALTKTFVVRADGTPLGVGRMMLREALKLIVGPLTFEISTLIGGMQVWWSGVPWWDHLAGSVVMERADAAYTERPTESIRSLPSTSD